MCTLLHRCDLKILAQNWFDKSAIFVKNQHFFLQLLHTLQKNAAFQKCQLDNLVDFEKCCKTHIFLQKSVPIQPKTSNILPKFCQKLATTLQVCPLPATPVSMPMSIQIPVPGSAWGYSGIFFLYRSTRTLSSGVTIRQDHTFAPFESNLETTKSASAKRNPGEKQCTGEEAKFDESEIWNFTKLFLVQN